MKAALAGIAATIIIAVSAYFVLGAIQQPASERYAASESVRLDSVAR